MKKLSKTLLQIITAAVLFMILTPTLYFAWRMGQPLPQAEFKGLTYYQFVEWRKMAYEERIAEYQQSHPDKVAKVGACDTTLLFVIVQTPQSFAYTVAGLRGIPQKPNYAFPENVTVINFVPKWWETFEYLFWYNTVHRQNFGQSPVEYCRIQPNVPTPEEFETIKREAHTSINN